MGCYELAKSGRSAWGNWRNWLDEVESMLLESPDREIATTLLGERLMDRLKAHR